MNTNDFHTNYADELSQIGVNKPSLTLCKVCGKPINGMPFHTCNKPMTTPTPETDAETYSPEMLINFGFPESNAHILKVVSQIFARKLERKRDEAREEIKNLKERLSLINGQRNVQANNVGGFTESHFSQKMIDQFWASDAEIGRLVECDHNKASAYHMMTIELIQLRKDNETFRNAQKSCIDCDAPTLEEVKQLRKVCDELYWLSQYSDRQCSRKDKVIANYSTLPHVIKAKGNKQ